MGKEKLEFAGPVIRQKNVDNVYNLDNVAHLTTITAEVRYGGVRL